MQIGCGELRWEGARQHAGRRGNRANSLRRAALAGSETAFKPWKWLVVSSMQSCWRGFFRAAGTVFSGQMSPLRLSLKNLGRKTGQTVPRPVKRFPKAEKWDMHGKTFVAAAGFVLHESVEKVVGRGLMQSCWHEFFATNCSNTIALKHCVPKIGQTVLKCWAMGRARAKLIGRVFSKT